MINDGVFTLGDIAITAAGVHTGAWVDELEGMASLNAQFRFAYGSGGGDIRVFLQTSLDQGVTAIDIACVLLGTASETALLGLKAGSVGFSGSPPAAVTPSDGALADNTVLDGVLGDRLRMKIVSTGTYAGQTVLSGRVAVR